MKFNKSYGILWGRNRGDRMKKKWFACFVLCVGAMVLFAGRLPCHQAEAVENHQYYFLKEGVAAVGSVFERMGIHHGPASLVLQNGRPVVVYRGHNAPQPGQKQGEWSLCGIITGL